jgi:uncharacterized membrane protein
MTTMAVPMRSVRERVLQTVLFEAGGLLVVTPLVMWVGAVHALDSLALLAALSAVVMGWAAFFNTVFDAAEARLAGRVASERPHRPRILHAIALESSAVLVSCPVIVALTTLDWWQALAADVALTLVYATYGYVYHWAFDRWRPVRNLCNQRET